MKEKILSILKEEIVPAEGCTEPIALAYSASLLVKAFGGRLPDTMDVFLSGNMIKNVKSVHIPNSDGQVGIEFALAMGAVLGDSEKKLMVFADVKKEDLPKVQAYVERCKTGIHLEKNVPKLYIRLEGTCGEDKALVELVDMHTNVTRIWLNGQSLMGEGDTACQENRIAVSENYTDRSFLTIDLICRMASEIDLDDISELFGKVIEYNSAIAEEGLRNEWGIAIGKTIYEGIADGSYGNDLRNNLSAFAAAGSDARMNGCPLPVMTTSGSGNQGMTCSLPVIRFCQFKGLGREAMIRGLFVSHLITIHIKESIGRLSAYCGAVAASAGVSGALCYMDGLSVEQVEMAVQTTLATISGVICDGAKSSCATKIATGVSSAVDAYFAAKKGRGFNNGEGIVGCDIESTISHVGTLGCDGMSTTDDVILEIMLKN